jgi:hypothetical protein
VQEFLQKQSLLASSGNDCSLNRKQIKGYPTTAGGWLFCFNPMLTKKTSAPRNKPTPRFTTLKACLTELQVSPKKEALIVLGKKIADAHYNLYKNRPQKIEVVERDRVMIVASYPIRFKKMMVTLIKEELV